MGIEDKLFDWSVKTLSSLPPVPIPTLVALFVVGGVILGTARRAFKADVSPKEPIEGVPIITLSASPVYTMLGEHGVQLSRIENRLTQLEDHQRVTIQMLRRRAKKPRKKKETAGEKVGTM